MGSPWFKPLQGQSTHWAFCFASLTKFLNESCESPPDSLTKSADRGFYRIPQGIFSCSAIHLIRASCTLPHLPSNSGRYTVWKVPTTEGGLQCAVMDGNTEERTFRNVLRVIDRRSLHEQAGSP